MQMGQSPDGTCLTLTSTYCASSISIDVVRKVAGVILRADGVFRSSSINSSRISFCDFALTKQSVNKDGIESLDSPECCFATSYGFGFVLSPSQSDIILVHPSMIPSPRPSTDVVNSSNNLVCRELSDIANHNRRCNVSPRKVQ